MLNPTPIPLTQRTILEFTGTVLPGAIQLFTIHSQDVLVIGSTNGDLAIFCYLQSLPSIISRELGNISAISKSRCCVSSEELLVVCTLEGLVHVFKIQPISFLNLENYYMSPTYTSQLYMNVNFCIAGDLSGNNRTEMLLSNTYGYISYYKYKENAPSESIPWVSYNQTCKKYWSLVADITSLRYLRDEDKRLLFIGLSDGNIFIMQLPQADHPERSSAKNYISEKFTHSNIYILVSSKQSAVGKNSLACINGLGKLCYFKNPMPIDRSKEATLSLETTINKRPISIVTLNQDIIDNEGEDMMVVGSSDGCVLFISPTVHNFYRYEEDAQIFTAGRFSISQGSSANVVCVVNKKGLCVVYSSLRFLSNTLPNFLKFSEDHVKELRKILSNLYLDDNQTKVGDLIMKYTYMPLP